jgi:hypothetical protein
VNLQETERLVAMLRDDLLDEWTENHAEHCGCDREPGDICHWQPPLTLGTSDVAWLTLRRLREGEDAPYLGKYFRYGDLALPERDDASDLVVVEESGTQEALNGDGAKDVTHEMLRGSWGVGPKDAVVDMLRGVPDCPIVQDGVVVDAE